MKRRNKNKKRGGTFWLMTIFCTAVILLLLLSVIFRQIPDKTFPYLIAKISGDSTVEKPGAEFLQKELIAKDYVIDSLQNELKKHEQRNIHKKALVKVETTLNMRDKASLASNIVARIPDSVFVDVLYFDTQYYYLNGQRGRWCKVRYADKEGWVWDGFLEVEE